MKTAFEKPSMSLIVFESESPVTVSGLSFSGDLAENDKGDTLDFLSGGLYDFFN